MTIVTPTRRNHSRTRTKGMFNQSLQSVKPISNKTPKGNTGDDNAPVREPIHISMTPDKGTNPIIVGEEEQLSCWLWYNDGYRQNITYLCNWYSFDVNLMTVDNGLVTAINRGTNDIFASYDIPGYTTFNSNIVNFVMTNYLFWENQNDIIWQNQVPEDWTNRVVTLP